MLPPVVHLYKESDQAAMRRSVERMMQELRDRQPALKFKNKVGASPQGYLLRWRMLLAADKLTNSGDPISIIVLSLSYESQSAFSTAFKRVMGRSPRQYGRGANTAPHSRGAGETPSSGRHDA
jgi:AraC-like DNA-binding protein